MILVLILGTGGFLFSQSGGYFSLDYSSGQTESAVPDASFLGLEAGILFQGALSSRIEYISEFSIQEDSPLRIEQALFGYKLAEALVAKAGLFPVPFGEYNLINRPHLTPLIQIPLHTASFLPHRWRDAGLLVEGETRGVYYCAYIGNGLQEAESLNQGFQYKDNNKDKSRGGKIGISLGSGLRVTYSYYWGKYDSENLRNINLSALNAVWESEFVYLLYERIWTALENPEGFRDGDGWGDLALGAVTLGSFQPYLSYQKIFYQDEFHGPGFYGIDPGTGIAQDQIRWAAGISFLPAQGVQIKVEYDWNREKHQEVPNNLLSLQVAVGF